MVQCYSNAVAECPVAAPVSGGTSSDDHCVRFVHEIGIVESMTCMLIVEHAISDPSYESIERGVAVGTTAPTTWKCV